MSSTPRAAAAAPPPAGFARLVRRPGLALFALLFGVYAYFYQAGGWNQNSRFDLVRAIVEDRSLQIDRFEGNTGDDSRRLGHYYCDKAPGASLLCVPPYAAVYAAAGAPKPPRVMPPDLLAIGAWLAIVFAVSVPSAVAATFVARGAARFGASPAVASLVALAWGLASMALPYATLLYGNQLAASLLVIAFVLVAELAPGSTGAQPRFTENAVRWRLIAVGALLGYAGATEYPAALIGGPIGLYALHTLGLRRAAWGIVGAAVPLGALLAYHAAAFGSPFAFPYDYSVWETPHTGVFMGIGRPRAEAIVGILVGEYRGLLRTTPWLALAVPGAVVLLRRHRAEVLTCGAAVLLFLWLNASIPPWHGGWAAGPRYLVPMLPFAALLATGVGVHITGALASEAREERRLGAAMAISVVGLVLVGAAHMLAATAVKPEIPTDKLRPYAEYIWPAFLRGDLALSTQSIDMLTNPEGAPRQAFNLGMKLGLGGLASLAPLALWVALAGAWLTAALRRASGADSRRFGV